MRIRLAGLRARFARAAVSGTQSLASVCTPQWRNVLSCAKNALLPQPSTGPFKAGDKPNLDCCGLGTAQETHQMVVATARSPRSPCRPACRPPRRSAAACAAPGASPDAAARGSASARHRTEPPRRRTATECSWHAMGRDHSAATARGRWLGHAAERSATCTITTKAPCRTHLGPKLLAGPDRAVAHRLGDELGVAAVKAHGIEIPCLQHYKPSHA